MVDLPSRFWPFIVDAERSHKCSDEYSMPVDLAFCDHLLVDDAGGPVAMEEKNNGFYESALGAHVLEESVNISVEWSHLPRAGELTLVVAFEGIFEAVEAHLCGAQAFSWRRFLRSASKYPVKQAVNGEAPARWMILYAKGVWGCRFSFCHK